MIAGFILASGLALAGAYCWLKAMFAWLDGDYPDESNRSFPAPPLPEAGERDGGGVAPCVTRPEPQGALPPYMSKWQLIALGMKARLK